MVYTVIVVAWRKPGLSPAEFKSHMEDRHIPLLQTIAGPLFPRTHTRHYIQRTSPRPDTSTKANTNTKDPQHQSSNQDFPATILIGDQADFDYDTFAQLAFDDEAAWQRFASCVQQPEAAAKIAEDEDRFLHRSKMRVAFLADSVVTRRSNLG